MSILLLRVSSDLDVRIIDLDDTTKVQTLTGHKNGVRKATWHPSSSFLVRTGLLYV